MTPEKIRAIIGDAVGNPSVGPVAEVLDQIADALATALTPKPSKTSKD